MPLLFAVKPEGVEKENFTAARTARIFIFCALFVAQWVALDLLNRRCSLDGLATPWYPQAAASLAIFLVFGWSYFWLVPLARLFSSVIVWPAPVVDRLIPTLIFTLAIAAMGISVRKVRERYPDSPLVAGALSALVIIALDIVLVILRQAYFHWEAGGVESGLARLMLENALGDLSSLLCLTLGFEMLLGKNLRPTTILVRKLLVHYWAFFLVLFAIAASMLFSANGLGHRLWYLMMVPCLAFAILTGAGGALEAVFLANIVLGVIAMTALSRESAMELQVFFISLNLLTLFLGSLISMKRENALDLAETAQKVLDTQLVKVRVLLGMKSIVMQPLGALAKEIAAGGAPEKIAESARELQRHLDSLQLQFSEFERPGESKSFAPLKKLAERALESVTRWRATGARLPEFEIELGDEEVHLRVWPLAQIIEQLAVLSLQIQAHQQKKRIRMKIKGHSLRLRAELITTGSSVSSGQISFRGLHSGLATSLPPGGYALTAFLLNALAKEARGKFRIFPKLFRFRECLCAEVTIPLQSLREGGGNG